MFYYNAFGLNISSEIKLPGVIEKNKVKCDVKISFGKIKSIIDKFGKNSFCYRDHYNIYLWWEDIGEVKVSNGNRITIDIEKEEELIIPFLLGPVMAVLLYQRGYLVLHGSAVNINNEAFAFIGYKECGKSTTAINLYKRGYPIITDDILPIFLDQNLVPYVYPGYPHIKLSEDSYTQIKNFTNILIPVRTITGKNFCDVSKEFILEPVKLKKIYFLEKGNQVGISSLNPQEILLNLLRHSFAQNIFNDKDRLENLNQCAALIKNVDFCKLEVFHSFKNVSNLIKLLEVDISIND